MTHRLAIVLVGLSTCNGPVLAFDTDVAAEPAATSRAAGAPSPAVGAATTTPMTAAEAQRAVRALSGQMRAAQPQLQAAMRELPRAMREMQPVMQAMAAEMPELLRTMQPAMRTAMQEMPKLMREMQPVMESGMREMEPALRELGEELQRGMQAPRARQHD